MDNQPINIKQNKPFLISDEQKDLKMIKYELIQQVKCGEWIHAFAIDQKNNILIAGMEQDGKLGSEIQSLQAHTNSIFCLYCMKNTQSFVSGGWDNSIKIWCLDKDNNWKVQQTLNGHQSYVHCIIMNSKEDLLISGGDDKTVRFWRKLTDSWSLSQTVEADGSVFSLSINGNEDKLIACIFYECIFVMNIQSDQEWKLIQTIKVNEFGYRLQFTIQDQFVFQPETLAYLEVYDYDTNKQLFYQKTKVKVRNVKNCHHLFPCQYIQNLNILTVKHGQYFNIFKVCQNGEYQLISSIEYPLDYIFGRITDDGECVISWNLISKEIQVRRLKYNEQLYS